MKNLNFEQYELVGSVVFGIEGDGGGIIRFGNQIIKVQPRSGDPIQKILTVMAKAARETEEGTAILKELSAPQLKQIAEIASTQHHTA